MMKRTRRVFEYGFAAAPARVFPLLCPQREHAWIDGWEATIVSSDSGVAEDHCVFTTHGATWVVTRYEPAAYLIAFAIFGHDRVERLDVSLQADGDGTASRWVRTYTPLNEAGVATIEHDTGDLLCERMDFMAASLTHFLAHGTMLRRDA